MDYYSTGRTNYFKVKDPAAFKSWAQSFGAEIVTNKKQPGCYALLFDNGIPDMRQSESTGDELVEFDFFEDLKDHLKGNEVAIYMEAGAEGHRYVNGFATAVCPGKKDISISIDQIYDLAEKKFKNQKITSATY